MMSVMPVWPESYVPAYGLEACEGSQRASVLAHVMVRSKVGL